MEPRMGLEPTTCYLRNSCSAIELPRPGGPLVYPEAHSSHELRSAARGGSGRLRDSRGHLAHQQVPAAGIDLHGIPVAERPLQDLERERVLEPPLNDPLQRPGSA